MATLAPFDPAMSVTVASWVGSAQEALQWATVPMHPVDPTVFARWHSEKGVQAFVLVEDQRLVAYGEIWEDHAAGEAELARLLVQPGMRGRGLGGHLARRLTEEARAAGFTEIWVRVVPHNWPARRAYANAGFERTTPAEEAAFNSGQPCAYVWMRQTGPPQ